MSEFSEEVNVIKVEKKRQRIADTYIETMRQNNAFDDEEEDDEYGDEYYGDAAYTGD